MMEWISDLSARAMIGAVLPVLDFLGDAGSRYFWLYCATGLLIAAVAYRKHSGAGGFKAMLLSRDMWLSESAINDYIIAVLTPVLRLTLLSWGLINWKPISDFVVTSITWAGVSGTVTDGQAIVLGMGLTACLFIVDDFLRFYTHLVFHRVPELWEFHKVHHSAEHLNFVTADRHHPVEPLMSGAVLAVGYGLVNGLFIGLFGDKLSVTTVAGANVFLFVTNICGGVLRHSPFWISFGPRVERWIISPAMHQIHHSEKPEHYDRNMGSSLSVWDRWFGTIHIPRGREIEGFGIGEETKDFRSLEVIMFRPFAAAAKLLRTRFEKSETASEPNSV